MTSNLTWKEFLKSKDRELKWCQENRQLEKMDEYISILKKRIDYAKKNGDYHWD